MELNRWTYTTPWLHVFVGWSARNFGATTNIKNVFAYVFPTWFMGLIYLPMYRWFHFDGTCKYIFPAPSILFVCGLQIQQRWVGVSGICGFLVKPILDTCSTKNLETKTKPSNGESINSWRMSFVLPPLFCTSPSTAFHSRWLYYWLEKQVQLQIQWAVTDSLGCCLFLLLLSLLLLLSSLSLSLSLWWWCGDVVEVVGDLTAYTWIHGSNYDKLLPVVTPPKFNIASENRPPL